MKIFGLNIYLFYYELYNTSIIQDCSYVFTNKYLEFDAASVFGDRNS